MIFVLEKGSITEKTTFLPEIPTIWKRRLARMIRYPVLHKLMVWGVKLIVPRQRVGVAIIAVDELECVLLLRHVFHPVMPWGVPGGWLNRHEAPAAGALRELREETGLTAVLGPVVHVMHSTNPQHIGISYLAEIEPAPIKLSAEIIEARWFALDELPPLLPSTREAIETAVNIKRTHNPQKI